MRSLLRELCQVFFAALALRGDERVSDIDLVTHELRFVGALEVVIAVAWEDAFVELINEENTRRHGAV